ncbi:MAG TPA: lysylphosphatidylglycerol synthase transmembrane domain-containing protein, partial [Polyangiaceae bacterium]|nr:lysylphosphatidylglycerol synthase transmembrane domain-containing protein [Polyangiaceae bacterium]
MSSGPAPIRDTLRHWPKLVVSLLVALGFWWLLRRGALPLMPPREAFTRVSVWGVALHLLVCTVMLLVRAGRWYWLLAAVQRVPLVTVMRSALIGFVAIVVMPFRTGEVVRPLLIRRDGRLSAWAASGTVGAERIIDGLWITGLLLVSLLVAKPVEPLPDRIGDLPVPTRLVPGAAYATALVFVVAFVLMALFYWRQRWARRTTEAVLGIVSPKLAGWVASRLEQVAGGLEFLK